MHGREQRCCHDDGHHFQNWNGALDPYSEGTACATGARSTWETGKEANSAAQINGKSHLYTAKDRALNAAFSAANRLFPGRPKLLRDAPCSRDDKQLRAARVFNLDRRNTSDFVADSTFGKLRLGSANFFQLDAPSIL